MTLGRYPALSLGEARGRAREALAEIAKGVDPALARKGPPAPDPLAVETVVADFIQRYARVRNRDWRETERLLMREFVSHWQGRAIGSITKGDVITAVDAIVRRGSAGAANRTFAQLRRFFNWCVERELLELSPCQGLKPPAKPRARDRVLSDAELASVWRAADAIGYPFGAIVHLLMLTAQRRGKVTGMRWGDLDLDKGLWSLPASRTKTARAHEVPLTESSLRLLRGLPRLHDMLVFPARGRDNPVSGFPKWKRRLDEASGVSGWRLHDIRRTVATGMARLGVAPHVVERVLNHASDTFAGVAGVYNRFGYLPEMRAALEVWERHVLELRVAG